MRGFVASWFYPPTSSSESYCAYKLLKNSSFTYDVVNASSLKWSYTKKSELISKNVKIHTIDTEDFNEWIYESISLYNNLAKEKEYDFVMTRSMPPESHKIGLSLKKTNPNLFWIASCADPIGLNPYEIQAYMQNPLPSEKIKRWVIKNQQSALAFFEDMGKLYKLENEVLEKADLLVFPTIEQCRYALRHNFEKYIRKCIILPHSFDPSLYPEPKEKNKKFTMTYTGHLDSLRDVSELINAINLLKDYNPQLLDDIKVRLVGNVPSYIKDKVYAFFLQDIFNFEEPVSYIESLRIMNESDCLIHIDALFDFLPKQTIFFAAKLADYMGTGKPILGLTNVFSASGKILKRSRNEISLPTYNLGILKAIVNLYNNRTKFNSSYYERYNAIKVAKKFDNVVIKKLSKRKPKG